MDYGHIVNYPVTDHDKVRVAYYARVSTDKLDQEKSIQQQKEYFNQYIKSNEKWVLSGEYFDEGISGTNALKRTAFMKMINDSKDGKIDLILTKSVPRFARNTVDTLHFTRELKKYGTYVFFTLDSINTGDSDGELRLSIMASIAQEDSRKISENVKWGARKRMESGYVYGRKDSLIGYKLEGGKLEIIEDEAKIVRLMFRLYLDGWGFRKIANELERLGHKTKMGNSRWDATSVKKILQNEKYCGMLYQGKRRVEDFLTHKPIKVTSKDELIIVEDSHEKIVSKDVFKSAQDEMERRRNKKRSGNRHSNEYAYSGIIQCGQCGKNHKRRMYGVDNHGNPTPAWMCSTRADKGKKKVVNGEDVGCDNMALKEDMIDFALKDLFRDMYINKDYIFQSFEKSLEKWLDIDNDYTLEILNSKKEIEKYEGKISKLFDLYVDGIMSKEDLKSKQEEYKKIIKTKEDVIKKYDEKLSKISDVKGRIEILKKVMEESMSLQDDISFRKLVKLMVKKIVLRTRYDMDIYLNSNLSYNVLYGKFNNELEAFSAAKNHYTTNGEDVGKPIVSCMIREPVGHTKDNLAFIKSISVESTKRKQLVVNAYLII